ncbi:hypothetical protein BP6252_02049 [Coleophoma cylindrospora]|uniref:Protein phosphatase n=1 Tax=Coleophoma cylindrospora TaxID=1849047 RepID=A0A3D8SDR9_9HELO|nr:hypothetical protein BP6252_02049 [Coleophoma cylindrospora]
MNSPMRRLALTTLRPKAVLNRGIADTTRSPVHFKCMFSRPSPLATPRLAHGLHNSLSASLQPRTRSFHASACYLSSSNPKFTYGIAASFNAKDHRYNPNTHVFNFNPYNTITERRKNKRLRPASGQDAFFVSRIGESADVAFGVADGVGGWVDSGVDPADFAHGFCDYMAYAANQYQVEENDPLSARGLMQIGYDAILKDETVMAGGSTACVALAKEDGTMEVANLGDSGFVQLRLNAIHNLSEHQTHAFNTPYQLSKLEQEDFEQSNTFGTVQIRDTPKDAQVTKHSLRHGDILIFASDGVWDNLSAQDILRVVSRVMVGAKAWEHTDGGITVGKSLYNFTVDSAGEDELPPSLQSFLAVAITSEAKAASTNTKRNGPFAREVQKYFPNEHWRGGKVDDICVVVAVAVEEGK